MRTFVNVLLPSFSLPQMVLPTPDGLVRAALPVGRIAGGLRLRTNRHAGGGTDCGRPSRNGHADTRSNPRSHGNCNTGANGDA